MNIPQRLEYLHYSPRHPMVYFDLNRQKKHAAELPVILLIDDDPDQLEIISLILRREKYRLRTTLTAEQALSILGQEKVSCIVSDVMMPGLSGSEFVKLLRQKEALVPILMISAAGDELEMSLLQSGADMYCSKKKMLKTLVPQIKLLLS